MAIPLTTRLLTLYDRLLAAYGPQHWWPADSPGEVMIGAVLTQNTRWQNVERAIATLRTASRLSLAHLHALSEAELAGLIRPAGYFNVKAHRLKNLSAWATAEGGIAALARQDTAALRAGLLQVKGIGPETADAILLYAFDRPVFVIDAYTRRLLQALQLINGDESYQTLSRLFTENLPPDYRLFNEYHALIVQHAKQRCSATRMCTHCLVEAPDFYPP